MVNLGRNSSGTLTSIASNEGAAIPKKSSILHLLSDVCPKFISNTLFLVAVALSLILITSYRLVRVAFSYNDTNGRYSDTQPFTGEINLNSQQKRLHEYCPLKIPSGSEGKSLAEDASAADGLSLKYLLITIRHGDRSAIHRMPGSLPIGMFPDKQHLFHLEPDSLKYREKMGLFTIDKVSDKMSLSDDKKEVNFEKEMKEGKTRKITSDHIEPDSLNRTTLFETSDFSLNQGQLTTRGFMQHILLGKILQKSYSTFLKNSIKSPSNVFVRSTKYDRTIQSVAALLTTLLPDVISIDQKVRRSIVTSLFSRYFRRVDTIRCFIS